MKPELTEGSCEGVRGCRAAQTNYSDILEGSMWATIYLSDAAWITSCRDDMMIEGGTILWRKWKCGCLRCARIQGGVYIGNADMRKLKLKQKHPALALNIEQQDRKRCRNICWWLAMSTRWICCSIMMLMDLDGVMIKRFGTIPLTDISGWSFTNKPPRVLYRGVFPHGQVCLCYFDYINSILV